MQPATMFWAITGDFTQADDVRANGLIPLGYYCEADVETDSPADPILSIGSGWRDGSSAVQQPLAACP